MKSPRLLFLYLPLKEKVPPKGFYQILLPSKVVFGMISTCGGRDGGIIDIIIIDAAAAICYTAKRGSHGR